MTPANDDGHVNGRITANAAREMAIGYAALATLADTLGLERVAVAIQDHAAHNLAAAIGKRVIAATGSAGQAEDAA